MFSAPRLSSTVTTIGVLTAALTGCGGRSALTGPSGCTGSGDIVVGVVAPISGAAHAIVGSFTLGAQQAVDDVNTKGGVCGRRLRLVVKDDESDFTKDTQLARELVETDHVSGVVTVADSSEQVMGPYLQGRHILTAGAFTGDALDDPATARDTFSVAIPNSIETRLWAKYLFGIRHVRRPAVLYETTTSYGALQSTAFCAAAQANGTPCVDREATTIGTTGVETQIAGMRSHDADSILVEGFGIPVVRTVSTAREAGITGPIVGTGTTATSTNLVNSFVPDPAREGYVFVNYRTATQGDSQAALGLAHALRKTNLLVEPLFVPMFAYDAVQVLATGWTMARSLDGDLASHALETLHSTVGHGPFTLHDEVYSPRHHISQVEGWLTLSVADALDDNGLAKAAPGAVTG